MMKRFRGNIFLLAAALVWGMALVAQKEGMDHLGPFWFTAIRCTMGGVALLPLAIPRMKEGQGTREEFKPAGPLMCGIFLALLILCQQFGLPHTTVGKAGFITALYVPMTPHIEKIFGKKITPFTWAGAGIAVIGLYMLCLPSSAGGLGFGDLCMLGAAFFCSLQMIAVDRTVKHMDPVVLSCLQFIICGLVCLPFAFALESISWEAVKACLVPILYAGLVSCGAGYTFQVIGQKYTPPAQAAIILSLETVFSLFAGMIFYGEVMSLVEYLGCASMFAAILISQKE